MLLGTIWYIFWSERLFSILLSVHLAVELLGPTVVYAQHFEEVLNSCPRRPQHLTETYEVSHLPSSPALVTLLLFFISGRPNGDGAGSHCGLDRAFVTTNDVEHPTDVLVGHWQMSGERSTLGLGSFKNWVVCLFVVQF